MTSTASPCHTAWAATLRSSSAPAPHPKACPSACRSWPATGATTRPSPPPHGSKSSWAAGSLLVWERDVSVLALGRLPARGRSRRRGPAGLAVRRPHELRRPQRGSAAPAAIGLADHAAHGL